MKKINLLNEFFNSQSDTSVLEASEQERLEKDFEAWYEEKSKDLGVVSRMLMKHLAENYNPHTCCMVNSTTAEILEGQKYAKSDEYLVD